VKIFALHIMICAIIFELVYPAYIFADEEEKTADVAAQTPTVLAEISDAIAQPDVTPATRLPLKPNERNLLRLLRQQRRDRQTGELVNLAVVDDELGELGKLPPGVMKRKVQIGVGENFFTYWHEGSTWEQIIYLEPGVNVQSYDYDSDRVYLLLTTGEFIWMGLVSMNDTAYRASTPVYSMGVVVDPSQVANYQLRVLRDKYESPDRSAFGRLTSLKTDPDHWDLVLRGATPEVVAQLRSNLRLVQPVKLSPILLARGEGKNLYNHNIALVRESDSEMKIDLPIITQNQIATAAQPQINFLDALQAAVNADTPRFLAAKLALDDETANEFDAIMEDHGKDLFLGDFGDTVADVLRRMNRLAPGVFAGERNRQNRVLELEAFTSEGLSTRQRINSAKWPQKIQIMLDGIERAEANSERRAAMGRISRALDKTTSKLAGWWSNRWSPRSARRNIRRLCWVLGLTGATATGAAADYLTTHGENVQLAVTAVAKMMPVLQKPGYFWEASSSLVQQALPLISIFFVAGLAAATVAQSKVNVLLAQTSLRWLIWNQISPLRPIYWAAGQRPAYSALREGEVTLFPYNGERRREALSRIARRVNVRNRVESMISFLAITSQALRSGRLPGEVGAEAAGIDISTPEGQAKVMELDQLIYYELKGWTDEELQALLSTDPAIFSAAFEKCRAAVLRLEAAQASGKSLPRWRAWMQVVRFRLARTFGSLDAATVERFRHAEFDDSGADQVARGTVIDLGGMALITAFAGWSKYANPSDPSNLMAQSGKLLRTHPDVLILDGEQIYTKGLKTTAGVNKAFSNSTATQVFQGAEPDIYNDLMKDPAIRPFYLEFIRYMRHMLDIRNTQPFKFIPDWHWNSRMLLLQSSIVPVTFARRFLKHMPWEQALASQVYSVMIVTFVYWQWALVYPARNALNKEIEEKNQIYLRAMAGLHDGIEFGDEYSVIRASSVLMQLYDEWGLEPSAADLQEIKSHSEKNSPLEFAEYLLEFGDKYRPVPQWYNSTMANLAVLLAMIGSTISGLAVLKSSMKQMVMTGFDTSPTSFFLSLGPSPEDGLLALGFKMFLYMNALWLGQAAINSAIDNARLTFGFYREGEREKLLARYKSAVTEMRRRSGWDIPGRLMRTIIDAAQSTTEWCRDLITK
jgi:hypothetical protein